VAREQVDAWIGLPKLHGAREDLDVEQAREGGLRPHVDGVLAAYRDESDLEPALAQHAQGLHHARARDEQSPSRRATQLEQLLREIIRQAERRDVGRQRSAVSNLPPLPPQPVELFPIAPEQVGGGGSELPRSILVVVDQRLEEVEDHTLRTRTAVP
jgi:hypothetical protein